MRGTLRLQIRICGLGQFFLTWVGADPGQTNLARPYPTLRAVCLDWIQTFGLKSVVLTWFNLISPAQHYFASVTGCGIAQYTLKFYQYDWNMLKSILNTLNRRTGRTVRATRNDARAIELRTDTTVERCARERHRTRIGHRVRTNGGSEPTILAPRPRFTPTGPQAHTSS